MLMTLWNRIFFRPSSDRSIHQILLCMVGLMMAYWKISLFSLKIRFICYITVQSVDAYHGRI